MHRKEADRVARQMMPYGHHDTIKISHGKTAQVLKTYAV